VIESDGEVLVRVADTGPGLAGPDVASAFQRGWSTKKREGRGLGLALVRQVVERHGGSYEVASAEGGGAVISVRLPVMSLPATGHLTA
jgi:signal transduction histidine kinase